MLLPLFVLAPVMSLVFGVHPIERISPLFVLAFWCHYACSTVVATMTRDVVRPHLLALLPGLDFPAVYIRRSARHDEKGLVPAVGHRREEEGDRASSGQGAQNAVETFNGVLRHLALPKLWCCSDLH